jgi:uncharacterized protein YjbI with pentapeptide repeats
VFVDNSHVANPEHLAVLEQGFAAWNAWRNANPGTEPELRSASLSGVDLSGANLSAADLRDADLRGANLATTNFSRAKLTTAMLAAANLNGAIFNEAEPSGADLSEANLHAADLSWAVFTHANLNRANLRFANLSGADFTAAVLTWANFTDTTVGWTVFVQNDLSDVKGLESVRHKGPSTIGIDVIYQSAGKIPEIFLRGAGVPDSFITYMKSLVSNPIEFYSCFISYSTQDQDFADRLYTDLQAKGVRCWFAPHDIAGGKKIHEQIDEAIRLYDRLLLILSPASMASEWVKTEISKARKREVKDRRRVLFPVRLSDFESLRDWELFDSDTGKDSAREIREYFIPDFSQWKDHDMYQRAFDRLLRDLKAEAEKSN